MLELLSLIRSCLFYWTVHYRKKDYQLDVSAQQQHEQVFTLRAKTQYDEGGWRFYLDRWEQLCLPTLITNSLFCF